MRFLASCEEVSEFQESNSMRTALRHLLSGHLAIGFRFPIRDEDRIPAPAIITARHIRYRAFNPSDEMMQLLSIEIGEDRFIRDFAIFEIRCYLADFLASDLVPKPFYERSRKAVQAIYVDGSIPDNHRFLN